MDFEEFREKLKEDLGERLFARTGDEFEITSSSVTKLQNAGYEGITVRKEGEAVGINLDVAGFYKGLEAGADDYSSILDKITEVAIRGFDEAPAFNVSDLSNYEVMKEHLSMQVVPTERNAEMLESIPHKEIEDMSVVCRFIVSADNEGIGSMGKMILKNSIPNICLRDWKRKWEDQRSMTEKTICHTRLNFSNKK